MIVVQKCKPFIHPNSFVANLLQNQVAFYNKMLHNSESVFVNVSIIVKISSGFDFLFDGF